ncbi:hypothetical protein CBR_g4167 [Chara braunii]|uniref:GIY-YIG domain-containing protein n=1 Tax=Chara braunii TaxID=69332 RepID=A0A388KHE8_CHABU|nr:hypothetical protein CBR_g4167 [Chara braunii]|eukprot:GBG69472.1 hypothetical protein CBR_g4167 [Chara braunii]
MRNVDVRWREHLSACRNKKKSHFHRWLCTFGLGNYVLIPVDFAENEELLELEAVYIKQWSPFLNTSGCKRNNRGRAKRRVGKKERSDKLGGTIPRDCRVVRFRSDEETFSLDLGQILATKDKAGNIKFVIESSGGNTWAHGWKAIRRKFGESSVKTAAGTVHLKLCKNIFETGGEVQIEYLRVWKSKGGYLKQVLLQILRNPEILKPAPKGRARIDAHSRREVNRGVCTHSRRGGGWLRKFDREAGGGGLFLKLKCERAAPTYHHQAVVLPSWRLQELFLFLPDEWTR